MVQELELNNRTMVLELGSTSVLELGSTSVLELGNILELELDSILELVLAHSKQRQHRHNDLLAWIESLQSIRRHCNRNLVIATWPRCLGVRRKHFSRHSQPSQPSLHS
ncbi:MAG: hypothetical protein ABL921_04920 [Pirellula sp.]